MTLPTRYRPAVLLYLALVLACAGDKSPTGSGGAQLSIVDNTVRTNEVLVGIVRGASVSQTDVRATLGAVAVQPVRVDDSTVAVLVPAGLSGSQILKLELGTAKLSASVTITDIAPIADPDAYIARILAEVESDVSSMTARYQDSTQIPIELSRAARDRDLAVMLGRLNQAKAMLATATPAERAELATFLAANASALGLRSTSASTSALAIGPSFRIGSGACLTNDGRLLETSEQCHQQMHEFSDEIQIRLVVLAAATAIAVVEGYTVVAAVVGLITAYVIYKELERIQTQTFIRFIEPVFAKLKQPFQTPPGPPAAPAGVYPQAIAAPITFEAGVKQQHDILADYRSISLADEGLSGLVTEVQGLELTINRIRQLLLLDPIQPLVPATPARTVTKPVPARYLSLGAITQDITGIATRDEADRWFLTFQKTPLAAAVPFSFTVKYSPPGLAAQTMSVNAELKVPPVTFKGTFVRSVEQSVNVSSLGYPIAYCIWSGTETGTITIIYRSIDRTPYVNVYVEGAVEYSAAEVTTKQNPGVRTAGTCPVPVVKNARGGKDFESGQNGELLDFPWADGTFKIYGKHTYVTGVLSQAVPPVVRGNLSSVWHVNQWTGYTSVQHSESGATTYEATKVEP